MGVSYVNFSVVRFAVCLTLGITAGYWAENFELFSITTSALISIPLVLLVLLYVSWQWNKKQLEPSPLFGILVCFLFFFIGLANYSLRLPKSQANHFIHYSSAENKLLQLKITEALKPDAFNLKYIAEIQTINEAKSKGKILLLLRKDSLQPIRSVDELLLVSGNFEPVRAPKNPHQFKYADYMKTLGVYGQLQLNDRDIISSEKGKTTLVGFSENIRNNLIYKLKSTPLQNKERSILQALVLGQRRDIDKSLYNDYAAAGAIHILAVSGLHVGILYFILLFICRPLTYLKYGSLARSIIIVVLLWGFAILAGLSPSVVRAVTMFSFFTFATSIKRPTNSFNTLFLSFFLLLLLRPNWLFHVGFQLSYLAVFAILWLQPKLYKLYKPKFYLDRLFWGIITVTITAQLGIVPLSLYYFHQFPGLFFVTNCVILPVLGILLAGGLLLVILAAFDVLPDFFAEGYNYCLTLLNSFISWIAQQDSFLFQDIPFSKLWVAGSYLMLVSLVLLWKQYNYRRLLYCLISFSVLLVILIWEKKQSSYSEMVIFNKNRNSLIGIKENKRLTVFKTDTLASAISESYPIKSYKTETAIVSYSEQPLPKYFIFQQQSVLVLDSLGVYPSDSEATIILLTHSPRVNLERLIESLQPKQIIADGSNYRSYVNRWRETCTQKKLPFYHTGTKGAFTLK
ncbi:ComEC/Rec2 family competence protein [Rasiella sp. SM2506]|uniref:ComEC/Rec2 family competence protein n=1 Tax=Rasiella sp. SM2506 TaxID=3423914 RepID=UPI003D7B4691